MNIQLNEKYAITFLQYAHTPEFLCRVTEVSEDNSLIKIKVLNSSPIHASTILDIENSIHKTSSLKMIKMVESRPSTTPKNIDKVGVNQKTVIELMENRFKHNHDTVAVINRAEWNIVKEGLNP